jgi:type I restriction enzyme, S subunit
MRYQPYQRYTASKVEWLGEIPEGWQEIRLKFVGDAIIGLTYDPAEVTDEESGILVLRANNIQDRKLVPDNSVFVDVEAPDRLLTRANDILICSRNGSRHLIGKNALVSGEFIGCYFGAFNTVFRSPVNDFLFHVFNSSLFEFQSGSYLTSTINQLTLGALNSFVVPLPPPDEQQQIAAFLDWKTGQIDALMARKQELLEKLKEKRIAVITQAVSQGLNPAAPMRDSGKPWLGQVPQHWEVRRLKFTASEPLQYGANEAAELDDPKCPRYIRITDIKEDGTLHEDTFRSLPPEVAEPYLLKDGDLLLARSGATVGKTFQYLETWGQAAYAGYLIRFRVDPTVLSARFAYYFLRSQFYWACINASLIQATIQNFSAEKYADINVPLPPLNEQQLIVAELEKQKAKIDKLEDATTQAIDRLTEYRTALITAATTGKIDVRKVKLGTTA